MESRLIPLGVYRIDFLAMNHSASLLLLRYLIQLCLREVAALLPLLVHVFKRRTNLLEFMQRSQDKFVVLKDTDRVICLDVQFVGSKS